MRWDTRERSNNSILGLMPASASLVPCFLRLASLSRRARTYSRSRSRALALGSFLKGELDTVTPDFARRMIDEFGSEFSHDMPCSSINGSHIRKMVSSPFSSPFFSLSFLFVFLFLFFFATVCSAPTFWQPLSQDGTMHSLSPSLLLSPTPSSLSLILTLLFVFSCSRSLSFSSFSLPTLPTIPSLLSPLFLSLPPSLLPLLPPSPALQLDKISQFEFDAPSGAVLSPAGEYNLHLGVMKEMRPDMIATSTPDVPSPPLPLPPQPPHSS